MIDETTIPTKLRTRPQWVCWRNRNRNGTATKVPIDPNTGEFASSTDDRTWGTLEDTLEYAESEEADGLGFVFTSTDPIVGVDLDGCCDPETGRPDRDAKAIIKRLDSYTEVSPSGTGYHVIVAGDLPEGRNRRGPIELYDQGRFFTVTGEHVPGTPSEILDRQDELEAVHREYVVKGSDGDVGVTGGDAGVTEGDAGVTERDGEAIEGDAETAGEDGTDDRSDSTVRFHSSSVTFLSDAELLEKASNASNGAKFDRLWNGSTVGYASHSEADMALCCLLAFWTGGDRQQMDRLFRVSGLRREKWDEVRYGDGSTYGEKTIDRAISHTSTVYDPDEAKTVRTQENQQREAVTAGETSDAGNTDRTIRYLTEKNRIQSARIEMLEDQLEEMSTLVRSLEGEIETLEDRSAGKDSKTDSSSSRESLFRTPLHRLRAWFNSPLPSLRNRE